MISKRSIVENAENGHFTLSDTQQSEIVNASTGKEAWEIRDQAIKGKFEELKQARKNAIHLNVILGSLAAFSLLLVAYLVIWKINPAAKDKEGIPAQPNKKQVKQKSKPSQ